MKSGYSCLGRKIFPIGAGLILLLCSCSFVEPDIELPPDESAQSDVWHRNLFDVDFSLLYGGKLSELKVLYDKYASTENYVECTFQFLEIPDTWYSPDFIYGYDLMPDSEKEKYSDMSVEGELYPVIAIQISPNCFDLFDIAVAQGRKFSVEDANYFEGTTIPVLVGSNYAEYVDLGDTFSGYYLLKEFSFCVVGIMAEGSNITVNSSIAELNSYVVMPSFSCQNVPDSESEDLFQVRHYVNKLTGLYPASETSEIQLLNSELEQLDIGYTEIH